MSTKAQSLKSLDFFFFSIFALACKWIFMKRTELKLDLLYDRKIYRLRACACTFQPGNFTGWGSDGVNQTMQSMRWFSEKAPLSSNKQKHYDRSEMKSDLDIFQYMEKFGGCWGGGGEWAHIFHCILYFHIHISLMPCILPRNFSTDWRLCKSDFIPIIVCWHIICMFVAWKMCSQQLKANVLFNLLRVLIL